MVTADHALAVLAGYKCEWCRRPTCELWKCRVQTAEHLNRTRKTKGAHYPYSYYSQDGRSDAKLCTACASSRFSQAMGRIND
jgi:hypothetical protein